MEFGEGRKLKRSGRRLVEKLKANLLAIWDKDYSYDLTYPPKSIPKGGECGCCVNSRINGIPRYTREIADVTDIKRSTPQDPQHIE